MHCLRIHLCMHTMDVRHCALYIRVHACLACEQQVVCLQTKTCMFMQNVVHACVQWPETYVCAHDYICIPCYPIAAQGIPHACLHYCNTAHMRVRTSRHRRMSARRNHYDLYTYAGSSGMRVDMQTESKDSVVTQPVSTQDLHLRAAFKWRLIRPEASRHANSHSILSHPVLHHKTSIVKSTLHWSP